MRKESKNIQGGFHNTKSYIAYCRIDVCSFLLHQINLAWKTSCRMLPKRNKNGQKIKFYYHNTYLDICLTYKNDNKKWKTRWNLKHFFQQNLNFFSVTNFSPKGTVRHLFVFTKNKVLHVWDEEEYLFVAFGLSTKI